MPQKQIWWTVRFKVGVIVRCFIINICRMTGVCCCDKTSEFVSQSCCGYESSQLRCAELNPSRSSSQERTTLPDLVCALNMFKFVKFWPRKSPNSWWRERRRRLLPKSSRMGKSAWETSTLDRGRMRERFALSSVVSAGR